MEKIYIGLSTKNSFSLVSEIIKLGEGTDFSHVYIRRKSSHVGEYVYQATAAGGVNFMGIDIFLEKNKIVEEYEFEISREDMVKLIKFFIANAGKGYSFKQILILVPILLAERLSLECKNCKDKIVNGEDKYICSELGIKILQKHPNFDEDIGSLDMITPNKLKPYLKKYGKRVV